MGVGYRQTCASWELESCAALAAGSLLLGRGKRGLRARRGAWEGPPASMRDARARLCPEVCALAGAARKTQNLNFFVWRGRRRPVRTCEIRLTWVHWTHPKFFLGLRAGWATGRKDRLEEQRTDHLGDTDSPRGARAARLRPCAKLRVSAFGFRAAAEKNKCR